MGAPRARLCGHSIELYCKRRAGTSEPKSAEVVVSDLISVVVATYNRKDALDAVLRGLSRQSDRNFEVIVADDGSAANTAELVAQWRARIPVPLHHVWHDDRGFRLAEIRNRAIVRCAGELCVFIDGDCIPRRGFVAAHRRLAETGWFTAGNRVLLSQDLTIRVLRESLQPERWGIARWIGARLRGDVNRIAPLFSLPLGPLRKLQGHNWRAVRGGNLAVARRDLDRVNGFDAEFTGWGREDSDIVIRLMRAGVRRKDGRFATAVLHLWHSEATRSSLVQNDERLVALQKSDRVQAAIGLAQLAAPQKNDARYGAAER